jgi:Hemerythrin HHE cation binding domain
MSSREEAVDLLQADQEDLKGLFEAFSSLCERAASDLEKSALAEEICLSLSVHLQLEEEIFYPKLRSALGADTLMDEAQVELSRAGHLMAEISAMEPSHPLYDARVTMLGVAVDQHVKAEKGGVFPKARRSNIDLIALGERIRERKNELLAEYKQMLGRSGSEDEAGDPVGRPTLTGHLNGKPQQKGA